MQEWLETLKIDVPVIERSALLQQACEHFNALDIRRNDRHSATINSDDFFLERITVNYLRHSLTKYERLLEQTFGKVGTQDAYAVIKDKVLHEIAEIYDWLAHECCRQECRFLSHQHEGTT